MGHREIYYGQAIFISGEQFIKSQMATLSLISSGMTKANENIIKLGCYFQDNDFSKH